MKFAFIKGFNFFVYGAISVYSTFFALYLQGLGWSMVEIGALLAGGPVVSIVANPLWGYLSDRTRNLRLILIIMLSGAMMMLSVVFATESPTVIYCFMLFFFFFQMPLFSQSNSLILNSIEGTSHNFGAFRLWGSLGWAVLAVMSGPIIDLVGIGKLWVLVLAMMLMSILFALGLPRGNVADTRLGGGPMKSSSFRSVFSNGFFLLFLFLGLVLSIPNAMNQTFISIYIAELGGNANMMGWAAFLSSVFEIPVFLLLDKYLKRSKATMMLCLVGASLLFAVRWGLMAATNSASGVLAVQVMHCITFGGFYYIGTRMTAMLVPSQYRASGQALYALIYGGMSGIIAGVFGGWLFQEHGARAMYSVGVGLALAGIVGYLLMYRLVLRREAAEASG
ncbi:MFS transporter [Paenibacillus chungangensis]|uniref:MFS transporter n=1 Tax=Paenibacillus chungangensis TaxID=696535 RepID=A0ABW3HRD1_9BACL